MFSIALARHLATIFGGGGLRLDGQAFERLETAKQEKRPL